MTDSALGEDDWGSNASSDDELMEDADPNEPEAEIEAEDDEDEDIGEDDDEEDLADQSQSHKLIQSGSDTNNTITSDSQLTIAQTSPSYETAQTLGQSSRILCKVRPEAVSASLYDIAPTMAVPQSTSINAIAATPDMRFWFSGGSDCYIRKYDGVATINGKTLLTVAQRHPFVDSVIKAGVLMSYWNNEEPIPKTPGDDPPLSPVYSLAVHSEALWLLSGLESGCINLYSVRHDEGRRIAYMNQHKSAVSVMKLAEDEKSVLSGSWDKKVFDWDLNTGHVKRSFEGSGGQISAIEMRPESNLAISEGFYEHQQIGETFSSNNGKKAPSNGISIGTNDGEIVEDAHGSQTDSLFGGSDTNSLFLETGGDNPLSAGLFRDEDDEASLAAVTNVADDENLMTEADVTAEKVINSPQIVPTTSTIISESNDCLIGIEEQPTSPKIPIPTQDVMKTNDSTFLAASIDGTIRIWDKRQPNPTFFIPTRTGVPPWCMDACWSPDGNFIYAGRRNGTVEEFSVHKGLKDPERTLKFPQGSGAVSALKTMPNGRHLIWLVTLFLSFWEAINFLLTMHSASHDILRLYDLKEPQAFKHSTVPFLIVPGPPKAGVIAALHIDPTCKYMISIAGNRGWDGSSTEVLIGYEIGTQS
ncbi:putative transcription factor spt8 [Golovinomyces cichoracearum]|uniref:Mitochondrial division protein 1 n=1 Tax=Golovinomyces cichoracearum TaxID=62708 RepID=A0A420IJX8_9PEZI|nr:putative transcription factor spt8 [Golovinomyces cichoracearum]